MEKKAAASFLRANFEKLGSVEKLIDWLVCQGFDVRIYHGREPNHLILSRGEIQINAGFVSYRHGKALWWGRLILPIYAHSIVMFIDKTQRIRAIQVNDTYA